MRRQKSYRRKRNRRARSWPNIWPPIWHSIWSQRLAKLFVNLRVALFAILLAFLAFNHTGAINRALDSMGRGFVAEANSLYLQQTKLHMGESILVLTSLDTALEVLESSSAGISFIVDVEVQVGNIVASLQKLTSQALKASLVAAAGLVGIEVIIKLAAILATPVLLLTITVLAAHYVTRGHWRWMANISGQISEMLVLVTLVIHIGLPLTIYGSSLASASITAPLARQAHTHFTKTHEDFSTVKQEKISTHVKAVIDRYKATSQDTHRKSRSLAGAVVRHIIAVLFDAFLFPGLMLLIVIWLGRVVIRHTLKIEKQIKDSDPKARNITQG